MISAWRVAAAQRRYNFLISARRYDFRHSATPAWLQRDTRAVLASPRRLIYGFSCLLKKKRARLTIDNT